MELIRIDDYRWLIPRHGKMRVDIAADISELAHVKPTSQSKLPLNHLPATVAGDRDKYGARLQTAANFDSDAGIRNRERNAAGHIAPAFVEVLHVRVPALDLHEPARGVRDGHAGSVPAGGVRRAAPGPACGSSGRRTRG